MILKKTSQMTGKKLKAKRNKRENVFYKNLDEGSKPLSQSRAHDDDNKPLLPNLYCQSWFVGAGL